MRSAVGVPNDGQRPDVGTKPLLKDQEGAIDSLM
jgi:hypothetical protein